MSRPVFDAESAVLACMLRDREAYWKVEDVLVADDFHDEQNRELFLVLVREIKAGKPADAVSIGESFPELAALAVAIDSSSLGAGRYIRNYAEQLSSRSAFRRLQAAGRAIARLTPADDAFATARRLLADCEPRVAGAGPRHISEFARMSAAGLLRRYEQDGLMTGIPTGYQPLDDLLGGWQETDLIIVAARPSVGKSAFTMQSVLHATSPGVGRVGLFASLEMSGEQLSDRAISHLGRINAAHIRQPKQMEPDEWPRSSEAFNSLQKLGLFVDDASGMTVEAICARARQLRAAEPLALIAIDYLTYIDLPKNDTQEQGIQHVTRTLKGLAKELRVPVILLSQLNRDGDDEPELKHLRGSGAIEQDADVVIFLHRPNKADRSTVKAKVAKHRNGALGEFYMHADMAMQRFTPMDAPPPPPAEQAGTLRRTKPAAPRARQGRQIVGAGYDD